MGQYKIILKLKEASLNRLAFFIIYKKYKKNIRKVLTKYKKGVIFILSIRKDVKNEFKKRNKKGGKVDK